MCDFWIQRIDPRVPDWFALGRRAQVMASFADSLCGYGCFSSLPSGASGFTTLALSSSCLAGARLGDRVDASAVMTKGVEREGEGDLPSARDPLWCATVVTESEPEAARMESRVALDRMVETVGFVLAPVKRQPGAWLSADGVPVDLMVPQDLAGAGSATTRGARIPPHHKRATRRARGLEAAMVDNSWLVVAALDPADDRRFEVRVASSPLVPRRPAQRWPVVPKLAWANPKRWRSRARHWQRTSSTPWSATQRWASGRLRLLTTVLTNPSSAAVTRRISQHSPSPKPLELQEYRHPTAPASMPEGTS